MFLPHHLEFRASIKLAMVLTALHLAALAALLPLHIPVWIRLALAAAVAVSFAISIRRHALLLAAGSIRELNLKTGGMIEGQRKDGKHFEATVSGQTTLLPWLIVLLLQTPGSKRPYPMVILRDSLPAEDGRILRAWLRWKLT